jgi:hypothetical protein
MRKSVTLGIVCIICLIAFLATDRMAFAQAGSTGGTIGKTDKSALGWREGEVVNRRRDDYDRQTRIDEQFRDVMRKERIECVRYHLRHRGLDDASALRGHALDLLVLP